MNIDEMSFWTKMKEVLKEAFSSSSMIEKEENIEPTNIDLEAETQTETVVEPQPTVEEPKVEEPVVEEPKVEEPKPNEEQTVEQPKDNHLEELVNSLKDEIKALKEMNNGLKKEIKNLGKQPSTEPVNTNAKPSNGDTYSAWREQMRAMIG